MAPKHHPTPLSGGDCKALNKELGKARAMTNILAAQSAEVRAKAATLLQQADRLLCESWNERMWSDGEPIAPPPPSTKLSTEAFRGLKSAVPAARH
jgi:hypothetical protein